MTAPVADRIPTVEKGEPLLSVRDLKVTFTQPRSKKTSVVVDGFNLDITPGSSVAVVGESGSGKTVSMRALMGVLPDTATVTGSAVYEGKELIGMPENKLRRVRGAGIGMVFQNAMSALNPTRTLKVQLTEHLKWHGITNRAEATRRAIEALDRVGIPNPDTRIKMYPFQLSGGQRQRAMIAMAIVAGPKLLIADEPTTALDVTVQRQVLDLLKDLRRNEGLALAMITHDLGVAKYMCDDVVVMRYGEIVEAKSMQGLLDGAEHPYSNQLLDAAIDVVVPDLTNIADISSDAAPADEVPETELDESQMLVTATDLEKIFRGRGGEVRAVTDVDISIARGETVGVVGESGSGKSTLARLLTRLIEPTEGDVSFDGADVLGLKSAGLKAWRRRVQMVFQNPYSSLLPHLTVVDNVLEPLRVHQVGTKEEQYHRALDLLSLVGIPEDRAENYPRQFSGGQQQRIAIARALSLEPELLVCDEPTSALDVSIQAQVLDLLEDLQERLNLSMLFITHNLAVAQRLSDRIIVMANGTIMESAPTDDLFGSPQHEYTQSLLSAILPIRHDPATVDEEAGPPRASIDGELTEVRPGHWVRVYQD